MEFKAISNGTKSVNILNKDGSIVFRVNPEYPLSRLIIDKYMEQILVKNVKLQLN